LAAEPSAAAELEKYAPTPAELQQAYQRSQRQGQATGTVYKAQITPHWFHNNTRFWYRNNLPGGTKEFILVDAERGRREAAFDHAKLAAALSRASGTEYRADRLPFDRLEFSEDAKTVRFQLGETSWQCDLTSYQCSKVEAKAARLPATEPAAQVALLPPDEADLLRLASPHADELEPGAPQAQQQGQGRGQPATRGGTHAALARR
jgi:hypothetical protein